MCSRTIICVLGWRNPFSWFGRTAGEKENLIFSTGWGWGGGPVMHQSTSKEQEASGPPPAHSLKPSQAPDHSQPKEMCRSVFVPGINSCSQTATSGCFRSLSTPVFCLVTTLQNQPIFPGEREAHWIFFFFSFFLKSMEQERMWLNFYLWSISLDEYVVNVAETITKQITMSQEILLNPVISFFWK